MIRTRRPPKPDPIEAALVALEAEELELLRFLAPVDELGIQDLHKHSSTAIAVVDRLVAKGEVTRYDGALFGVSDLGHKRLAPPTAKENAQ